MERRRDKEQAENVFRDRALEHLFLLIKRRLARWPRPWYNVPDDLLWHAFGEVLPRMAKWIERNLIPSLLIDASELPETIPDDVDRYFNTAFKNEVKSLIRREKRAIPTLDPVVIDEMAFCDSQVNKPETPFGNLIKLYLKDLAVGRPFTDKQVVEFAIKFQFLLYHNLKELAADLDTEMIFYLAILNCFLTDRERVAATAYASGDPKDIAAAKEELGENNYHQTTSLLFGKGGFQRVALKVAQSLRRTGQYWRLGLNQGSLEEVIRRLRNQID